MTQTLIGIDYAGVPAVKITKGAINPATEPDSNVGSFLFNSKWAADIKMTGIDPVSVVGASQYIPAGTGQSNFQRAVYKSGPSAPSQLNWFRNSYFSQLLYTLPLYDVKHTRISNGRFVGSIVLERLTGYDERAGNWVTGGNLEIGWCTGFNHTGNTFAGFVGNGTFTENFVSQPPGSDNEEFRKSLIIWRLPGDETAILNGSPLSPVEGQHVIEIDNTGMRVSKPGYDVRTASATQLAFDSANQPTKIIAAADINCPPGVTSYNCGMTIPAGTIAEVHFYEGSTIIFPANPVARQYGCEYWFSGSNINFNNPYGTSCRARFYVLAYAGGATTSGDNDVIRQFASGGEDVVQILRPGAGASPAFGDIIVDSRWPSLQMLAQGTISVGTGTLTHTVNFSGAGTFPMVKYMTIHGAGSSPYYNTFSWSKRVRMPFVNMCGNYSVGWTYQMGGDSTYCSLTNSQAVFRTFRGNPIRRYYASSQDYNNGVVTLEPDPSPITGIRYFIFGIPT